MSNSDRIPDDLKGLERFIPSSLVRMVIVPPGVQVPEKDVLNQKSPQQ